MRLVLAGGFVVAIAATAAGGRWAACACAFVVFAGVCFAPDKESQQ